MKKRNITTMAKDDIREYFSTSERVAGATSYIYNDGFAKNTSAIQIRTGTGFTFEVLPDRGMDIHNVDYCGIPISWEGKCGVVHPSYYEAHKSNILRTFLGGMLTTCGLANVGESCDDDETMFPEHHGLHGRINYTPAHDLSINQGWKSNEFCIDVSGKMHETRLYGENLRLSRTISCKMGENRFFIFDEVENLAFEATPLMLLYHINFGYPVVSPGSKLFTGYSMFEPFNDFARNKMTDFSTFPLPTTGYEPDNIRFHKPVNQENNYAVIFNYDLDIGAYVRFKNEQLPYMTEWIQANKQEYVVGIEPGNCLPEGRVNARKNGRLEMIQPNTVKKIQLEIGVIEDQFQLEGFIS